MDPVVAHARSIIERGSKSFAAAARLFDPATRERAFMLYAWCRYCDDVIDGQTLGFGQQSPSQAAQRTLLADLQARTESAMNGEPTDDPVFAGFQRVYQVSGMARRYPLELLEGFAMDASRRSYHTLDDTLLYCYHVAGVVGAMMATVMGVRDAPTLARAVDLGLAFQLTNIARDVFEDAADGRVYLPRDWLRDAGAPEDPAAFPGSEALIYPVVARLLDEADRYYDSAAYGIGRLPFRSAWAIAAARNVYRAIGDEVRRRGASAWESRAGTGTVQKVALLAHAAGSAAASRRSQRGRPLPERTGLWQFPIAAAGDRSNDGAPDAGVRGMEEGT